MKNICNLLRNLPEITICVTSCGELTERACLKAIEPFKNEVEIIHIRNVYPQVKALNLMLDKVKTDYLIAVDADILLNADAWSRITAALQKYGSDNYWHSILFPLWDTLTQRKILALKLMRTRVMKRNRFRDTATPDIEHFERLKNLGYACIQEYLGEPPIGKHVVKGKRFCYHKLRDLYQTYRSHGWEWDAGAFLGGKDLFDRAQAHFAYFVYRWVTTGRKDYLWCIAGMMDGIFSPLENTSKDLRTKCSMSIEAGVHLFFDWYWKHLHDAMFPPPPPAEYFLF